MVIVKTLEEFKTIPQTKLVDYLKERYIHLMQEYSCSMNDICEALISKPTLKSGNRPYSMNIK